MNFTYNAPTKVYFGNIDYNCLISVIKQYGDKVLILTGGENTFVLAQKISDKIKDVCSIILKSGVKSNPEIGFIESIIGEVKDIDVILTIGGGSVHDSGKALAIALTHNEKLEEYTTDGKISVSGITDKVLPVITIPTIFGTGAEVSPAALLRISNKKRVIFSPYLYPRVTFIDCELTKGLSKEMCIKAALDALVQGIESLVSSNAQSFSKRFSYSAIERSVSSLISLVKNDDLLDIMEELALASIESLYAVGQSSVGAVHAISDPISGRYDIHHGEAVGILLPYVVEENYLYAQNEYDAVKNIFESHLDKAFDSLSEAICYFYDELGFDLYVLKNKIDRTTFYLDFKEMISESYNGDMIGNPRKMTDDVIGRILLKAFGEK